MQHNGVYDEVFRTCSPAIVPEAEGVSDQGGISEKVRNLVHSARRFPFIGAVCKLVEGNEHEDMSATVYACYSIYPKRQVVTAGEANSSDWSGSGLKLHWSSIC